MSSFSNVSLILMADRRNSAPEISRTVHALATKRWDTQVLLVEPELVEPEPVGPDSENEPETRSLHPRFSSLSEAISSAHHPVIAIVDGGFEVSPSQWQLAAEHVEQSPVHSVYCSPIAERRYKRLLLWIYTITLRLLFRVRRNELQSGLTVLHRNAAQTGRPTPPLQPSRQPSGFQVTQMLANLRLNRVLISETEINDSKIANSTRPPNTRSIVRAGCRAIRYWWNEIMFPCAEHQVEHKKTKLVQKYGATALLLTAAAFVLFSSLNYPLIEPDEARNAQIAVNLVESGQWMSQTLANEDYWDKPPLQIWAIAASYKVMGISPFSTRFPIALAAFITILSTLLVGKRLVGFRAAWLGSGLLLLSSAFVFCGRFVTLDASLTAMVSLALMLGFIAIRDRFSKRSAIFAGIACGLGFLIKGPIIFVLCGPPLLAYSWLSKPGHARPKHRWIWFALPAALIASPWFIATGIVHPDFLTYFFWKHHVLRFSDAFNHQEPFWYYLVGIFLFMFPASYLLPSVTRYLTSRCPENRLMRTREQGFLFLSALWVIGFFSMSQSKLPTYILPSFPPICLLMGVLLEKKVLYKSWFARQDKISGQYDRPASPAQPKSKRTFLDGLIRRAPYELVFFIVAISVAIYVVDKSRFVSFLWVYLPIALLTVLVVVLNRYRAAHKIAWASFGLLGLFIVMLGAHHLMPAISQKRSVHLAAAEFSEKPELKDAPVVYFGRETFGVGLAMDTENVIFFEANQNHSMIKFLKRNPTAIIVSSTKPMEKLREDLPWTIVLEECEDKRHLFLSYPNHKAIARERAQNLYR